MSSIPQNQSNLSALVISGGGARGAWAVGVLRALVEHLHESFDIFVGTSTGALIAPLAALGEIAELKRFYTSVRHRDILQNRVPVNTPVPNAIAAFLLGRDAVYGTKPLRKLVKENFTEERWKKLLQSGKQVWVSAINLQTGEAKYFGSPEAGMDRRRFASAMVASSSIPVLMSRARISGEDGYRYVDGGVRDLIPIKRAIELGARRIRAILLDAKPRPVDRQFARIHEGLLRFISLSSDETARNDVEQCELITREIAWRRRLRKKLLKIASPAKVRAAFQATSEEDEPMQKDGRKFVAVDLKLIRPEWEIGGVLDFDPAKMQLWEQQGYDYACVEDNWSTSAR